VREPASKYRFVRDIAVFFVQVQNSNELLFFYDKKILVLKFLLQAIEIKQ